MAQTQSLWELDELARRYGTRPSAFLGLKAASWEAYQLDVATLTVGLWLDGKLAERDSQGKPVHRLADLLSGTKAQSGYRSLSAPGMQRLQVPESGIW